MLVQQTHTASKEIHERNVIHDDSEYYENIHKMHFVCHYALYGYAIP